LILLRNCVNKTIKYKLNYLMKTLGLLSLAIASLATANAASITLTAGFGSSGIVVTQDTIPVPFTVDIGGFAGGIFTVLPVTSAAVNKLAGEKIAGAFGNDNTDPASLTGDPIFARIRLASGAFAILSTPQPASTFPDLTAPLASRTVTMGSGNTIGVASFGGPLVTNVSYTNPNTLNFVAIPEPSTMLLGALGALGLLRRRR
jgi:hypothetical protein